MRSTPRGHEIGIRMALGAQKSDVVGLAMKEGTVPVRAGTLIGMALTWAGLRLTSGFFFSVASVKAFDPALLVGAPLLLASLAFVAAMCRRGSRCGLIQQWRCGRNSAGLADYYACAPGEMVTRE